MPTPLLRPRRASRRASTYRHSLLLGWTASLGVLLLAVHLPLSSALPRVGWGVPHRPAERIPLTEIAPDSEPDEATTAARAAQAPPPTQQTRPTAPAPDARVVGQEARAEVPSPATKPPASTPTVWTIADLETRDHHPRILGGPGALQLHIHYPAAAREQGIQGRLVLTFTVDPDGWARRIHVTQPLHPLCDSAAVAAIRAVRFQPGTYKGTPVPVRMSLPVRFQLQSFDQPSPAPRRTASTRP